MKRLVPALVLLCVSLSGAERADAQSSMQLVTWAYPGEAETSRLLVRAPDRDSDFVVSGVVDYTTAAALRGPSGDDPSAEPWDEPSMFMVLVDNAIGAPRYASERARLVDWVDAFLDALADDRDWVGGARIDRYDAGLPAQARGLDATRRLFRSTIDGSGASSTPLMNSIDRALAELGRTPARPSHRELVVITDGRDTNARSESQVRTWFESASERAIDAGISVSVLAVNAEGNREVEYLAHLTGLALLAARTGGVYAETRFDESAFRSAASGLAADANSVFGIDISCVPSEVIDGRDEVPVALTGYAGGGDQPELFSHGLVGSAGLDCARNASICTPESGCGAVLLPAPDSLNRRGIPLGFAFAVLAALCLVGARRRVARRLALFAGATLALSAAPALATTASVAGVTPSDSRGDIDLIVRFDGGQGPDLLSTQIGQSTARSVELAPYEDGVALIVVADLTDSGAYRDSRAGRMVGPQRMAEAIAASLALLDFDANDRLGATVVLGAPRFYPPSPGSTGAEAGLRTPLDADALQSPVFRAVGDAITWLGTNAPTLPPHLEVLVISDMRAEDTAGQGSLRWQAEQLARLALHHGVAVSGLGLRTGERFNDEALDQAAELARATGGAFATAPIERDPFEVTLEHMLSDIRTASIATIPCYEPTASAPALLEVRVDGETRDVTTARLACPTQAFWRSLRSPLEERAADEVAETGDAPSSDSETEPADEGGNQQLLLIIGGGALVVFSLFGMWLLSRSEPKEAEVAEEAATNSAPPEPEPAPRSAPVTPSASSASDEAAIMAADTARVRSHPSTVSTPHVAFDSGRHVVESLLDESAPLFLSVQGRHVSASEAQAPDDVAELRIDPEHWRVHLRRLGNDELSVEGRVLPPVCSLGFGTSVWIGSGGTFELREGAAGPAPTWSLSLVEGPSSAPDRLKVAHRTSVLGREPNVRASEVAVQLPGEDEHGKKNGISGNHATMWVANGLLYVCDEDSSYGTFVNGERLHPFESYRLDEGDELVLSDRGAVYRVEGPGGDA